MLWRIPVAAALAAVLIMMWGFVFWTMLPFAKENMHSAADEAALTEALAANLPKSGVYFVPNPFALDSSDAEAKAALAERHQAGPLVHIFYRQAGGNMEDPIIYAQGLGHYFLTALLAAVLVGFAAGRRSFFGRFFVALLLVAYGIWWLLPANAIWYYHDWRYVQLLMGYNFVGGLLMSLVVALLVKGKRKEEST